MNILSAPLKVSLEITNLCNLDCQHCNVASTKNMPGDLTTNEWKRLIDELASLKVFNIIISGGEPFMRKDIFDIISHIFNYHFRLHLNTNGTLIDHKTASFLKQFPRIENIQVSLDGSSPEIHEKIRPEGSFNRALEGIKYLTGEGLPVSIYTVMNRYNIDDIENIILLAKGLKLTHAALTDLLPVGNARENKNDMSVPGSERRSFSKRLRELRKKHRDFMTGPALNAESFFSRFPGSQPDSRANANEFLFTACGGFFEECCIRPDGWVTPCSRMWEYKTANVREHSFREIWKNDPMISSFRNRRNAKISDVPECKGCGYTSLCAGGCPAIPFEYGKGVTGWDPTSCYKVYTGEKESYINKQGSQTSNLSV